jgi:cytochrome c oxidase subunit 2
VRELNYAQPQAWIAILFAVIVVLLVAAFVAIGRSSRREVDFARVKAVGYGVRTWWFAGLAVLLTCGVALSIFNLPYSGAREPVGAARAVAVQGGQFYWTVAPDTVPAGRVRMSVTSADVNHGLGVYSPAGELLGSVQAMPGYTNTLDVQLDEPGEYLLSCLEMCGVGHHHMHAVLKVAGR